jgi:hypothetical protein
VYLAKELGSKSEAMTSIERAPRERGAPAAPLETYAGKYRSTELDATFQVSVENGNLMLRMNWNPPEQLTPGGPDEFYDGYRLSLTFRRSGGRIAGFDLSAGRVRNVGFERID